MNTQHLDNFLTDIAKLQKASTLLDKVFMELCTNMNKPISIELVSELQSFYNYDDSE